MYVPLVSASYPRILARIDKENHIYPGILCVELCRHHSTVLAIVWQDKSLVHFLTAVHEATPDESNFVFRDRKRPQINPENRRLVQQGLGGRADQNKCCFHDVQPIVAILWAVSILRISVEVITVLN